MEWPTRPTCHDQTSFGAATWEAPGWRFPGSAPTGVVKVRVCGFCGSIHPEDLYARLTAATLALAGADWKYGWPHKFYLRTAEFSYPTKWYNEHLTDEGYEDEALQLLLDALHTAAQIRFSIVNGQLHFEAPYYGYQAVPSSERRLRAAWEERLHALDVTLAGRAGAERKKEG
jgi:hypothetical protein